MTRQLRTLSGSGGRALTSGLLLFASLAAHGCDSDDPIKFVPRPNRDSGAEQDASQDASEDSGDAGSGADGGGGSGGGSGSGGGGGGMKTDAGAGGATSDAGDAAMPVDPCELSDDANTFSEEVSFSDDSRFAVTTGTTGFGVVYQGIDDKLGCGLGGVLEVLPVQASGKFVEPKTVLEDCKAIRDTAVLHVAEGWRVVWVDTAAGSYELQSMLLAENMSAPVGDLRTRLTENDLIEERPVLANVGGVPLVAYLGIDDADKVRVSTLRLAEGATPQDIVADSAGRKPMALAVTQIGEEHAAIAWADEEAKPGVWVQPTDLMGVAQGEPILVSDAVSAGTTVDLAARDENEGGAVLYSIALGGVNREVRFRRLSETGALLADETKVIAQPLQGSDASFARLGGGYAVAYRALPGGSITRPEIRLTFITKEGYVMRDARGELLTYKVADTESGGGRTTLRVSTDGQLLIGFVDGAASSKRLRLVRKRLDCAL